MRIYSIEEDIYEVYLNRKKIDEIDLGLQTDLEKLLRKVFLKLEKMTNDSIKGTYYVEMYQNKECGCFLIITKKGYGFIKNEIDLKINVLIDSDFYFETELFEVIKDVKNIYSYKNMYYVDINDLDDTDKYVEFGNFIPFSKVSDLFLKKIK